MRRRGIASSYNSASRLWLLAAGLSLLAPVSVRLGYWLPIHLALAGAVSVAISGNMMTFAATLTATPGPGPLLTAAQFALVNAGALLIAIGYPASLPALVAVGGAGFVAAAALLLVVLRSAWRRSLNRRHRVPMVLYGLAASSVVVGGTIGAILGSGAVTGASFEDLRIVHLSLNVLGWVSLTIVATLVTLLPTVLRIRMPRWNGGAAGACLVGGLVLLGGGLAAGIALADALGAFVYWCGAVQVAVLVARGLRAPRKWPAPAAAKHMVLGVVWFVVGTSALVWTGLHGSVQESLPVFEVSLVCGWALQILLGSWLYLLPMARPGPPEDRRRWLAAVDVGATAELGALNAGLILIALAAGHIAPAAWGLAGAVLAIAAASFILAKTWIYPVVARMPAIAVRSLKTWGA